MLSTAGATDSWLWGRMSQPALFFLALLAHCPAYSYHIMVHLHNPACDWSQFNGGWQSISITMFLLSVRQQKHNSDEICWRTDLFSNHKEEKQFNFQQRTRGSTFFFFYFFFFVHLPVQQTRSKWTQKDGADHCTTVQFNSGWTSVGEGWRRAECFIGPSEKSHPYLSQSGAQRSVEGCLQ